ncbi:MAG: DNA topoisomerase IB, partial [Verrucomicrobiaceae bacterium]
MVSERNSTSDPAITPRSISSSGTRSVISCRHPLSKRDAFVRGCGIPATARSSGDGGVIANCNFSTNRAIRSLCAESRIRIFPEFRPALRLQRNRDKNMKLVFTTDQMPGYKRVRKGSGFSFLLPDGAVLTDKGERRRLMSLAVPPAYENVWICRLPNGHLQATGVDARKRKQYRYHPAWHESAADRKFGMLIEFAKALPRIRARVARDLGNSELTRERVIAGIVALLDLTGYRIGNSRYEKENRSYGLSSLLMKHVMEENGHLTLRFRGKSGGEHETEVSNPRLTQLVEELQELPGQHLFRYEDDSGSFHDIETEDVNNWLKEAGGGDYTAKQFRTWRATLLCAKELAAD